MLPGKVHLDKLNWKPNEEIACSFGYSNSIPKVRKTEPQLSPVFRDTNRNPMTVAGIEPGSHLRSASVNAEQLERSKEMFHGSENSTIMFGNPIGLLHEMCTSRQWPPPSFEIVNGEGMPHQLYNIACKLFNQKTIGSGTTKKSAKKMAAYKMCEKLKEASATSNLKTEVLNDDENIAKRVDNLVTYYSKLRVRDESPPPTSRSQTVFSSHTRPEVPSEEAPEVLQNSSVGGSKFNYVQILEELASQNIFEVAYVEIDEKTMSGKSRCLVQLTTWPVAVCCGSGTTPENARSKAAQNALEYIKLLKEKRGSLIKTASPSERRFNDWLQEKFS